ncbi:P-loop containing nucleoside triphosphate hydrolase protein [Mollisia scopiformis]|uniref:p-loop containing nucleoside triphosphate hydrolase protein n=1 Tax=Mollisia scopiformis TaxID=149040 RepID=A0A194XS97_MOLSC|nr:P-loop containing nucleoside triphosphate hydrolase protein [Mollisia scopiformis]KUJ23016.1 P-loop containing nucleoside triphosphate hydrolase protein [Mollisia scopiformis]
MSDTSAAQTRFEPESTYKVLPQDAFNVDIEQQTLDEGHLLNDTVRNYSWSGVSVIVKDHKTKEPKIILHNIDGIVGAGEICALMGPSGCGKTTLLNVLAHRDAATGAKVEGNTLVNGTSPSTGAFRRMSSFVEQEDALIGSLTVRETMHFAARLAHKNALSKTERIRRIDGLLDSFGLRNQAHSIIGTPIRKGISGGQKRRLSVASQLITAPKMLFLDEPTSGLDSAASFEVVSFIKEVAKRNNLIVIASIHQPSTSTFQMFDKLLLLSAGKSHYFGQVDGVAPHFESMGYAMPFHTNPAEFLLEMMNTDFAADQSSAIARLDEMQKFWAGSDSAVELSKRVGSMPAETLVDIKPSKSNLPVVVMSLVHRSFIKSYRDIVAYGIRIAMYVGLAVMMGTVWLRLKADQADIQPVTNAIFFGSAFMSFMAVAYIPAFLEDRATYIKERANGLYGPTAFMIGNFLIGLPYLFIISLLFSVVAYWLSNFRPTAGAFFTWVMWLFLDLVAAESLVVFISSLFPIFVVSLALTAFANGLWMSVDGFMVSPKILNVFWRYVFHYIDYQTYVFQGMMVNEFAYRNYTCGSDCQCMFQTDLSSECLVPGQAVLDQYDYHTGNTGKWVGILLAIVLGYRLLGWLVLWARK